MKDAAKKYSVKKSIITNRYIIIIGNRYEKLNYFCNYHF